MSPQGSRRQVYDIDYSKKPLAVIIHVCVLRQHVTLGSLDYSAAFSAAERRGVQQYGSCLNGVLDSDPCHVAPRGEDKGRPWQL